MTRYYAGKLSGRRLEEVYLLAPLRTRQYLQAEIAEAKRHLRAEALVLELGCGYGRLLKELALEASAVFGVDNSAANLDYARVYLRSLKNLQLAVMDVSALGYQAGSFDVVLCLQNGIGAFQIEPKLIAKEALRVCRSPGCVIISTYSPQFWEYRLEWFRIQAEAGLLGELDEDRSRNGLILCKDGFRSASLSENNLRELAGSAGVPFDLYEVDGSSLFCILRKP